MTGDNVTKFLMFKWRDVEKRSRRKARNPEMIEERS